ncbi:lmo0937 family membrane protein [Alkalicoccus chagannorensis]|nr:lmo0937 family membrane protein [Alkalicoccus chagannorensis]
MIWTIIGILLLFWLAGLLLEVAGGLIHLLLVVALIVLIVKLVRRI